MVCQRSVALVLLLPAVLALPSGSGLHFPDDCAAYEEVDLGGPSSQLYVVVPTPPVHGNGYPRITWVYEERNGVEGLQRGDHFQVFFDDSHHPGHALDVSDPCHDGVQPDRIVAWAGGPQRLS